MQSGIQGSELHFVMKIDVHHTKTGGRKSDLLIAKAPKTGYVLDPFCSKINFAHRSSILPSTPKIMFPQNSFSLDDKLNFDGFK